MWRHTGQKTIMLRFAILLACVHQIVGPPMTNKTANRTVADHPDNMEKPDDNMDVKFELEYNRYLKEVVDVLESDPEFRKKLETADENDFRSGKVAAELDFVSHHVRTQLDELKRSELARLRELMKLEEERKKAANDPHHNTHLDHSNPHTFEVQDLQMLMNKVRKDLEDADKQRREEFKEYEMMKEYESEEKMKEMDEQHKKEYLKKVEEEKKAAAKHDPVHHPGSQAQLEEVWEKADHMSQKFNPKAFFYLHDLDGNGYWDEQEVNALFLKELDKIYSYQPNGHIDMRRREEEMERMREHVFTEMDANRDRFISYEEFYEQTKKDEWHRDDGWEDINAKPQFTEQEYQQFLARHQAEMENLRRQGIHPPPGYQHPIGVHPNAIPQYQQVQHPQQQYQGHPQQQYQGHPQQQYQAHPQQQYQAHPGAVPQQYQAHPGAAQQQYQAHPGAAQQQYQAHQGVPQQHYQAQPVGQFNPPPPAGHQVPQAGHQAPPAGQQYQPPPAAGHQAPPAGQQQQYQAAPAGRQQYQAAPAGQQQQYQAAPAGQQQQYQAAPAGQQQQYQAAPAGQQQQYQAAPAGQQQQYQPPPPAQFQPLPPGSQSPPDHGQPLSNELPQQAHNPGSPQTHNAAAPANLPNSIPVKIKSTEVPK